jgi:hypothetical protein
MSASPAAAQISDVASASSGTGSPENNAVGFFGWSQAFTTLTSTTVASRYAFNVSADTSFGLREQTGEAHHRLGFLVNVPGGFRLDVDTRYVGALGRIIDDFSCEGEAEISAVAFNFTGPEVGSSGTFNTGNPVDIGGVAVIDDSLPFREDTSGQIYGVSNGAPRQVWLDWNFAARVVSNSCEVSARLGEQSTSSCFSCGYPGAPFRGQSNDGHFVTVTVTSLCGNGVVDTAAGEQCDQGDANGSPTSCCASTCQFRSAGATCGPDTGLPCDLPDFCTGTSGACPNLVKDSRYKCRLHEHECDSEVFCDGSSPFCPADAKQPKGQQCRDDGNPCTLDQCDGVNDDCQHPAGNAGSSCENDGNACTKDVCDGVHTECQHPAGNAGTSCDDDLNPCTKDLCDGFNTDCQHVKAPGKLCREAVGECDVAEFCDDSARCPADEKKASGVACTNDSNPCTLDQCDGISSTCPHAPAPAGTLCRPAAGICDVEETCTGTSPSCPADAFISSATVCRAATGACDAAENCTGASATCPADAVKPSTTTCRPSAGDCDVAESCDGVGVNCPAERFAPSNTACGDASDTDCTNPDRCDGNGVCLRNDEPRGSACGSNADTDCTNPDKCDGNGACLSNDEPATTRCTDDGEPCTADRCDGAGTCAHPAGNAGTVCRADAGECDVADVCDGIHPTCPVDAFEPSGTFCGSSADTDCTNRDTCDGAGTCRANDEAPGTTCSDGDACTTGDQCDGTGSCISGSPTICPACELCHSDAGCVAAIDLACEPGVPGTSTLTISNNSGNTNDGLDFDWRGANAIAKADFGSPLTVSDYQLCIYDDKAPPGAPQTLVYALTAAAGGLCDGVPCWVANSSGFLYDDNELTPDGVEQVVLKAGPAGKSQVSVKGHGRDLGLVPHDSKVFFSQSNNVTVVLVANNAPKCFRADFPRPWLKNSPSAYKDRD